MAAQYIFGALSVVFLAFGTWAALDGTPRRRLQARTWLLIGAIFAVVAGWIVSRG
ncbi:MAG: hypothetical protein QM736_28460 [Vicinamibacterales bacterium]